MPLPHDTPDQPIVVIVVEDETLIRSIVVEALADAGFVALEAKDASDAIRILQTEAEQVDVLFTDVNMPGAMNGVMLARHAREHWPWIGLLVASGKMSLSADDLPANSRFFQKPYNLDNVVNHIRETASRA